MNIYSRNIEIVFIISFLFQVSSFGIFNISFDMRIARKYFLQKNRIIFHAIFILLRKQIHLLN